MLLHAIVLQIGKENFATHIQYLLFHCLKVDNNEMSKTGISSLFK